MAKEFPCLQEAFGSRLSLVPWCSYGHECSYVQHRLLRSLLQGPRRSHVKDVGERGEFVHVQLVRFESIRAHGSLLLALRRPSHDEETVVVRLRTCGVDRSRFWYLPCHVPGNRYNLAQSPVAEFRLLASHYSHHLSTSMARHGPQGLPGCVRVDLGLLCQEKVVPELGGVVRVGFSTRLV